MCVCMYVYIYATTCVLQMVYAVTVSLGNMRMCALVTPPARSRDEFHRPRPNVRIQERPPSCKYCRMQFAIAVGYHTHKHVREWVSAARKCCHIAHDFRHCNRHAQ